MPCPQQYSYQEHNQISSALEKSLSPQIKSSTVYLAVNQYLCFPRLARPPISSPPIFPFLYKITKNIGRGILGGEMCVKDAS